jgi:NhaP-type Na+/H+ or K+/H+ antiporter
MEFALIGVVAIVTIVAVAAFAKQLGIAAPLVLVVVGIAFSFIPGVPLPFAVPSWVILSAVLPPLLYSAAIQVPVVDLRRNLGQISVLSVILVIVTSFAVGLLLFSLLHGLDLGAAIALGAIVSPTDAVAATSIAKRLGLPTRLVTMLEGEGLVNDASALVLLKAAIGATGAGISLWNVAGNFAFSVAVAIVMGLLVGFVTVRVRSRLRDSVLDTAISFAVPFIAYIPTEELGASGVLAVVVAGIYSGHHAASSFSVQTRLSEKLNWRTVQFLLENGVFLLMGLQLRTIVGNVPDNEFGLLQSVVIALLLCAVILVIRVIFVVPLEWRMARTQKRVTESGGRIASRLDELRGRPQPKGEKGARRWSRMLRFFDRREADLQDIVSDPANWRGAVVLSWAGMRGVVTVAAAQSLDSDTPYRPQLILIAFTVAIVTLILQGGTLPWLIRRLGIRGSDIAADRRSLAQLIDEMSESGLAALETEIPENDGEKADADVIERVKQDTLLRSAAAWERAERAEVDDPESGPHYQYRALRSRVIAAERAALLDARSRGSYPSRVLWRAQELLDAEEARLAQGFGSA